MNPLVNIAVIVLVFCAMVVLIGRFVVPPLERVPLRQWRFADVRAAFAIGRAECGLVVHLSKGHLSKEHRIRSL
ncbi:hypothetical protein FB554_2789 [Barrientosiimonas humi]|uniref:Uncharacterized protein n=2 Tax=Barrientosiimonas TaxID=1535207 RepID=A0A542XFL4_9MICO|nr:MULTISPECIES: hypothetical protein [Barrientosiimonas]TQL34613.1 hypothetical protein FB554_2789 [Barrientosiimonas humi]BDZ59720.1 hypothetical protein GCM10025872_33770 [Barrientosiimonas endolithica]CAG7574603.1 hypothetical protein BH39T_PBIAJDOK_03259 [Barrientosiimonas humi]